MADADPARVLPLWLRVVLGVAGTAGALWGLHAYRGLVAEKPGHEVHGSGF